MNKRDYYEVVPFSKKEAEKAFATGDSGEIAYALLGLAYFESDWEYVRDICIKFLSDENNKNHSTAVICLGHLARIHQVPELKKVIPLLKKFLTDPKIGGIVEDAIQDIKLFTKLRK